jgi:hypothetical protein
MPSLDSSSSSSNEKFLDEINVERWIAMQATIACINTWEFFIPIELEEGGEQYMDLNIGMQNVLMTMWATPCLFKSLTNFNLTKFEELTQLVVPIIIGHARSTKETHHIYGQPSKLTLEQCLFNYACSTSYCIWSMIMSPNVMRSYGIGKKMQ